MIWILALLLVQLAQAIRQDHFADEIFLDQKLKNERHHDDALNLRPLIGIISQPGMPAPKDRSYIAASYVKFIEGAGARAVPILHDMTKEEVQRRFKAVNAILVPGGGQDLRPGQSFYDTTAQLFDLTLQANNAGDYFPMHGTCLGFQTIAVIASGNTSLLSYYDSEDDPKPLIPTESARTSRFFSSLPSQVAENLFTKPYSMENHVHGVAWSAFPENPKLDDFFTVLTLSVDRKDEVYVSTMEGKKYPITATQWHPEKNAYEWAPDLHIPHEPSAIEVTQEVANFIVGEARKNQHKPVDRQEEEELLIYNWNDGLEYTGKATTEGEEVNFDEIYVFPDAETFMKRNREKTRNKSMKMRKAL